MMIPSRRKTHTRSEWPANKHLWHCTSCALTDSASGTRQGHQTAKQLTRSPAQSDCEAQSNQRFKHRFASILTGASTKPPVINWSSAINSWPKLKGSCCTAFSTAQVLQARVASAICLLLLPRAFCLGFGFRRGFGLRRCLCLRGS